MINISSLHLKTALLYYYRFKRRYLCTDECRSYRGEIADILVDTGKQTYEIEIKLNKADLSKEKSKAKHNLNPSDPPYYGKGANRFSICVPTELIPYAEKWISEVNPKYGLIEFTSDYYKEFKEKWETNRWDIFLNFKKRGSMLHGNYNGNLRKAIISRLPSALCNAYINNIQLMERKNEKS